MHNRFFVTEYHVHKWLHHSVKQTGALAISAAQVICCNILSTPDRCFTILGDL